MCLPVEHSSLVYVKFLHHVLMSGCISHLQKNYLYGYRDREAVRADSLIYLPGFHVCPATDVKAKKYAFKIYHSSECLTTLCVCICVCTLHSMNK